MRLGIIHRYVLREFLVSLILCISAVTSLFIVFDFFERLRIFIKEDAEFIDAVSYLLFKIPLVIHLMTPVGVLIATLLSIGRLSQNSELTAMRACGISILSLARPIIITGLIISIGSIIFGETVVPWATQKVEDIYHLDIRKKHEKGKFSRAHFWYRSLNKFYNIELYDSRSESLENLSIYEINDLFNLERETNATKTVWNGTEIGWTMQNVLEKTITTEGELLYTDFNSLPLTVKETPKDFYNMSRKAETLSYFALKEYIAKLKADGIPVTKYIVDLAAKISFPFVNVIVVLVAFPFGMISSRSGNMTKSFILGVSVGFAYYIVHALGTSFGAAELLPPILAAWTANIILGCTGGFLILNAEN